MGERDFWALTAADLMTPGPITVHEDDTAAKAAEVLEKHRISGLAVMGDGGRVTGVISRADITRHYGNPIDHPAPFAEFYHHAQHQMLPPPPWTGGPGHAAPMGQKTPVAELMTPQVHSVAPDARVEVVVHEMREKRIHRLFVIDGEGRLVGVVSAMDVLAALEESRPAS